MTQPNNSALEDQKIEFDSKKGLITIQGIFITENPQDVFTPLISQLDEYLLNPSEGLTIDFKLEYFNTNMALIIRNLIRKLSEKSNEKTKLKVRWYFEKEDEDMEDTGEEFKIIFKNADFELIGVDNL